VSRFAKTRSLKTSQACLALRFARRALNLRAGAIHEACRAHNLATFFHDASDKITSDVSHPKRKSVREITAICEKHMGNFAGILAQTHESAILCQNSQLVTSSRDAMVKTWSG
jgi:hypothetical protein